MAGPENKQSPRMFIKCLYNFMRLALLILKDITLSIIFSGTTKGGPKCLKLSFDLEKQQPYLGI